MAPPRGGMNESPQNVGKSKQDVFLQKFHGYLLKMSKIVIRIDQNYNLLHQRKIFHRLVSILLSKVKVEEIPSGQSKTKKHLSSKLKPLKLRPLFIKHIHVGYQIS